MCMNRYIAIMGVNQNIALGARCSSMVGHFCSVLSALDFTLTPQKGHTVTHKYAQMLYQSK